MRQTNRCEKNGVINKMKQMNRSEKNGLVSLINVHHRTCYYLDSKELVTPCRLFIILIVSVVLIFSLVSSIKNLEIVIETPGPSQLDFNFSKQPYLFDYECALNDRQEMLERYGRTYHSGSVEKHSGLSIQEFGDLYDSKWPVIVTDVVPNWPASRWSKDFFLEKYGDERILLQAVEGRLVDGVGHIRTFREFFRHLQRGGSPKAWTYMEDEMFSQAHPEIKKDVEPNPYMEENFFKFFPDGIRPWDCMILWGSPYSRSTLHMDPYNWTAISGVIYGKKHWKSN